MDKQHDPVATPLLYKARRLCEEQRYEEAWQIVEMLMEKYPKKANPVILGTYILWKWRKFPLAYHLGIHSVHMAPQECAAHQNAAVAAHEIWLCDEAEYLLKTALRLANNDEEKGHCLLSLASIYIDTGQFTKAEETSRQALKYVPDNAKAKANLGFALLGQRKWEGWDWYSYSQGLNARRVMQYANEGPWDGTKNLTVACYGEQGLGDELSFASMVPDAIKDCEKVIIDCDERLQGLFQRSFPQAKVYGTRNQQQLAWAEEDRRIDASISLGELGKFYRRTDESFTGAPYLVADPDRRLMWRTLFDTAKKPVIGIAWTGGLYHTGAKFRRLDLEGLYTTMRSIDARYVSLQYKDASKEIAEFKKKHPDIDIVQYPFGTLTDDYDDTAAMVAEVDLVICMQTAVAHLAGGLGKDCWVLLPKYSQFRYGEKGDTIPWYKSLKVFRQRSLQDWHGPLGEVTYQLRQRYRQEEKAAA